MEPYPLIVASANDPASMNMVRGLVKSHGFQREPGSAGNNSTYSNGKIHLLVQEKECIYVEPSDVDVPAKFIFFASKHRSSSGTPALTVHATGNLTSQAEFGGRPEEVSFVEPFRMREAIMVLSRKVVDLGLSIEVAMEATHHGPTSFPVPVCFVEIGSGPLEWSDPTLGSVGAEAIVSGCATISKSGRNAVGFGGTHYSPKHTRLTLSGDYNMGHLVPKYAFDRGVTERMVRETFRKTAGGCKTAVVDWKGVKGVDRRRITEWFRGWDVEIVRI